MLRWSIGVMYELVVEPGLNASGHSSIWSRYPPVSFTLSDAPTFIAEKGNMMLQLMSKWPNEIRLVRVNGEVFDYTDSSVECESSLLSVVRHVTQLQLGFHTILCQVFSSVVASLQQFQQLRSLELRGTVIAESELADALMSLPSLTCLQFDMTR